MTPDKVGVIASIAGAAGVTNEEGAWRASTSRLLQALKIVRSDW